MADELSREEVSSRLEEIFSSSLEGDQLEKAVSSIPKRLDKFEGKWDGLIKWAEQKYGKNESAVEPAEEPEMMRGRRPAWWRALHTPMWYIPIEAPPGRR